MSAERSGTSERLPVGATLGQAFFIPWRRRRRFFPALFLPITILVLLKGKQASATDNINWGIWSLEAIVYCVLITTAAVTCHRLVLLGDDAVPRLGLLTWSWRETRFMGWTLVAWLYGWMLLFLMSGTLLKLMLASQSFYGVTYGIAIALILYPVARWSLVFPATAVDQRLPLADAWALGKDNGWRLMIILYAVPWGSLLLLISLNTPDEESSLLLTLVISMFSYLVMIFEVTALSLAFKFLSSIQKQSELTA